MEKFKTVENEEFASLLKDKNIFLMDVRTPEEFKEGHIAGAINVNVEDSDFLKKAKTEIPADSKVAVYCRSGRRSALAASELSDEGYNVYNLKDGILGWIASGFETVV